MPTDKIKLKNRSKRVESRRVAESFDGKQGEAKETSKEKIMSGEKKWRNFSG